LSLDLKQSRVVIDNTELKIDLKTSGGLQFDSGKLGVNLDDGSITGKLAVVDGGTGATTLDNLITLGSHTTGNYVQTITGGNGITSSGATTGENIAHSLSLDLKANHGLVIDNTELKIDLKTSGGLQFDSGKLGVKLDDTNINGTLPVGKGGTGLSSGFTRGDVLFVNSSGTFSKLAAESGKYLKSLGNNADPQWASVTEEAAATAGSLTAGNGLTSNNGNFNGSVNVLFSIDPLSGGGLVFHGSTANDKQLKVDLGGTYITGQVDKTHGGTDVTTGLTQLNATNLTSGAVAIARGGTGVATGLTQLNAVNLTSGAVAIARGGTGVTSGLTQLNAVNLTSGTVNTLRGGTGATAVTGTAGNNVLSVSPTLTGTT